MKASTTSMAAKQACYSLEERQTAVSQKREYRALPGIASYSHSGSCVEPHLWASSALSSRCLKVQASTTVRSHALS